METGYFSYGQHPLQRARVFQASPKNTHTLLFIHGGAWRDPNNTHDDFAQLVHTLQTRNLLPHTNLVSMNYRLSPEVRHPAHLQDVLECVRHLERQNCGKLSVMGHSVGATLMMQMLNWKEMVGSGGPGLSQLTLGTFYFVDGIYDMEALVQEYGAGYREFVEMAFGSDYSEASPLSWRQQAGLGVAPERSVVVHSMQDELLSEHQARLYVAYLQARNHSVDYVHENWGLHEEVYRRPELAELIAQEEAPARSVQEATMD